VDPCHSSIPVVSSIDDAQILGALSILDAGTIEVARLGASKASSKTVRDYATMELNDHLLSQQEGDSLARRLGITPALPPDEHMASEHIETMARLNALSGAAFDRAFMEAMVDSHSSGIVTVNVALLPSASHVELKAFIRKLLPTLHQHEQVGREWLDSHTG
jgi:putative membrane protein